ncbi:MAG TPA: hypothetical protein VGC76_18380 [Pyrinomonadaceae bacterium]|jgi:hypothetical protein
MKNFTSEPTAEERALIEVLIKYPSLEKAFDRTAPDGFAEIKQKMQATTANLERVVRRGKKTDAERASLIVAAIQTTIDFLVEMEKIAKTRAK